MANAERRGVGWQKKAYRIDVRLTLREREVLLEKSAKTKRPITHLIRQLIREIDKVIP